MWNFNLLLLLTGTIGAVNYCNMLNCKRDHIACNNDGKFHARCPSNATIVELKEHIPLILEKFNTLRNHVAGGNICKYPKAARMATMNWDNELAEFATLNVKMCNYKRDKCRNNERFINAGQMLATCVRKQPSDFDIYVIFECIDEWLEEQNHCNWDLLSKFKIEARIPIIYHLAMLITEDNTHVGCSALRTDISHYPRYLITCNFATRPRIGLPVYTTSNEAANKCITGPSDIYNNLCSEHEKYDTHLLFEYYHMDNYIVKFNMFN